MSDVCQGQRVLLHSSPEALTRVGEFSWLFIGAKCGGANYVLTYDFTAEEKGLLLRSSIARALRSYM